MFRGGGKNPTASVASYPVLTFFLKKILCMLDSEFKHCLNLNKLLNGYVVVIPKFHALNV